MIGSSPHSSLHRGRCSEASARSEGAAKAPKCERSGALGPRQMSTARHLVWACRKGQTLHETFYAMLYEVDTDTSRFGKL